MSATPMSALRDCADHEQLLQRRAQLAAEHHYLTLGQQEMVAAEALQVVDPELVCDALIDDESTVVIFLGRARQARDDDECLAWLRLSALQAVALKTPTMLALGGDAAGVAAPDRPTALKRAVEASGGVLTRTALFEVLRLGRGRWSRCNEKVAEARDAAARRSWQVVRLARHDELIELVGARSGGRRRRSR